MEYARIYLYLTLRVVNQFLTNLLSKSIVLLIPALIITTQTSCKKPDGKVSGTAGQDPSPDGAEDAPEPDIDNSNFGMNSSTIEYSGNYIYVSFTGECPQTASNYYFKMQSSDTYKEAASSGSLPTSDGDATYTCTNGVLSLKVLYIDKCVDHSNTASFRALDNGEYTQTETEDYSYTASVPSQPIMLGSKDNVTDVTADSYYSGADLTSTILDYSIPNTTNLTGFSISVYNATGKSGLNCTASLASGVRTGTLSSCSFVSGTTYFAYVNAIGTSCNNTSSEFPILVDNVAPILPTSITSTPVSPANNNSPVIKGTAETDSIVKMYSDNLCATQVGANTTAANFASTGITASVTNDTSSTFYFKLTDLAGNISSCLTGNTFVEDSSEAMPTSLSLITPASSPGVSDTPTIRVSGVISGNSVSMYTDNTCSIPALKATGTASSTTIDLVSSSLIDGSFLFYATQTDTLGNISPCSTANVAYQRASTPTIDTFVVSTSSPTNSTTFNFTTTTTNPYTHYCILVNDTTVGNCSWTAGTLPTSKVVSGDGVKTLSAWIKENTSGLVSARKDANAVTLDTTVPATITMSAPTANGYINPDNYNFTWNASSDAGSGLATSNTYKVIKYANNNCSGGGVATTYQTGLTFNYASLTHGASYTVKISAFDVVGNESTGVCSNWLERDSTVPTNIAFTAPVTISYNTNANYNFIWNASTDANSGLRTANRYYVEYFAVTACGGSPAGTTYQNTLQYNYTGLVSGNIYSLRVTAYDNADNASTPVCSVDVYRDTAAPATISYTAPTATVYQTALSYNFTWPAPTDTGGAGLATSNTYRILKYTQSVCGGTASSPIDQTATSYSYTGMTSGNVYSISVVAYDKAGNVSSASCSSDIYVDTVAPAQAVISLPASNILQSTTSFNFTWSAPTDTGGSGLATTNTYTVRFWSNGTCNSTETGNAQQTATNYTYSSMTNLSAYSVKIQTFDKAGNSSTSNCSNSVTVDQLQISPLASVMDVSSTQTFSSSLGSGGYSYSVVSGGGSFAGAVYTAPTSAGTTVVVRSTDSNGQTSDATIQTIPKQLLSTGTNNHNCNILTNGTVKCWGDDTNGSGKLGTLINVGTRGNDSNEMGNNLPAVNFGTGRYALQLTAGYLFVCAILDNLSVKCWGYNNNGQLGISNTTSVGFNPRTMGDDLSTLNLGTNRTAIMISSSQTSSGDGTSSCAILDNNNLKCWGKNDSGQLGYGDSASRGDNSNEMGDNLPAVNLGTNRYAVDVSMGRENGAGSTCTLLDNGQVKCWGYNALGGVLGYGDTTQRGDNSNEMGDNLPNINLGTGRTAIKLSTGGTHHCAILDNNTLKCWGYNGVGMLGYGDSATRSNSSEMGDNLPTVDLGTGRTPVNVSAGYWNTCVVLVQYLIIMM